jgi:hypothetical protein
VTPQQLQAIRDDWASVDPTSKTMLLMREDVYAVLNGYDALAAEAVRQLEETEPMRKRVRELEAARDLSALASATLRDESMAKNDRIAKLEDALRDLTGYDDNCTCNECCDLRPLFTGSASPSKNLSTPSSLDRTGEPRAD